MRPIGDDSLGQLAALFPKGAVIVFEKPNTQVGVLNIKQLDGNFNDLLATIALALRQDVIPELDGSLEECQQEEPPSQED